jgi:hypothetical protein
MLVAGSRLTFSMLLRGAMGKSSEAGMPCEKGILRLGRWPDKARADMNVTTEHVHQTWLLLQLPYGERERVTEQSAGCYAWSAVEAVAVRTTMVSGSSIGTWQRAPFPGLDLDGHAHGMVVSERLGDLEIGIPWQQPGVPGHGHFFEGAGRIGTAFLVPAIPL